MYIFYYSFSLRVGVANIGPNPKKKNKKMYDSFVLKVARVIHKLIFFHQFMKTLAIF